MSVVNRDYRKERGERGMIWCLRVFYFLLGFLIAVLTSNSQTQNHIPDRIKDVVKMGCNINHTPDGEGTMMFWYTYVWVEYRDKTERWTKLYSIRQDNERKKALGDCNDWIETVNKARKEVYERKTKTGVSQRRSQASPRYVFGKASTFGTI